MGDLLDIYLDGIQRLIKQVDRKYLRQADTLLQQLTENIDETKTYDDTRELKHDRSIIISKLNVLTRKALGISFYEYCGLSASPASESEPQELPEESLTLAHDYISSACYYISAMHQASKNASILFLSDNDIWPQQCQNAILELQQFQQPQLPENIPFSALEVTLFSISERVHELTQLIDGFSPHGRDKSVKARKLRLTIRQKLRDFPQCMMPAIDLINSFGESIGHPNKCTQAI